METPELYKINYYNAPLCTEMHSKPNDHFTIDYLLDFPNDDSMEADAAFADSATTNTNAAATAKPYFQAADIGGARGFVDGHFSNELFVPYDEMAELEWVSSFAVESFSSEDLQRLQLIQGMKARSNELPQADHYQFQPETTHPGPMQMSVPGKARSKRSRAAPGNWESRLLTVSPSSSSSETGKTAPSSMQKKKEGQESGEGRKCLHCAADKTPQWRTGPFGPKTLCNACGVRFKSGRLVPEYRPAASPTFVLTKHSNSHRKVLELRRKKEMQQQFLHHHPQTMIFDVSNGDDYLVHQQIGPDFRQLIHD